MYLRLRINQLESWLRDKSFETGEMKELLKHSANYIKAPFTDRINSANLLQMIENVIGSTEQEQKKTSIETFVTFVKPDWPATAFYGEDGYEPGDEDAPFFSEAFLYNLIGKEDARTVLALVKGLEKRIEELAGLIPGGIRVTVKEQE